MSERVPFTGCGTALVTPFNADGAIDELRVRALARRQVDSGVHFLVPCGTTGEAPTLTLEERRRVVELVVEEAAGRVPVLAGAGGYDTAGVVCAAREMAAAGADGLLSVTPYYNKPTPDGLVEHYWAIAEATPLPVIVYNVPGRTGCNLDPSTLVRLAERTGVVGVKEASGNAFQIAEVCRIVPDGFLVLSGDDALTLAAMAMGAQGVISVIANELPGEMSLLVELAERGDYSSARALHARLLPLMQGNFLESNPIPVKHVMATLGLLEEHYRLPLVPPRPETREKLVRILTELGVSQEAVSQAPDDVGHEGQTPSGRPPDPGRVGPAHHAPAGHLQEATGATRATCGNGAPAHVHPTGRAVESGDSPPSVAQASRDATGSGDASMSRRPARLEEWIERLWEQGASASRDEGRELFGLLREELAAGRVRAAESDPGSPSGWKVNPWVKQGILLGFRLGELVEIPAGVAGQSSFDKDTLPLKPLDLASGVRLVPGGSAIRDGAYVAPGVVCMPPAYVNVGAWVGEGTLIDSHALVGSCAQIGRRVHLSAGAQIGGVLEPVGALPVIVEDDVLVGGNAGVYEGAVIREGAVLAAGTILTASTPVYDLPRDRILRADEGQPLVIPRGAVVVPGGRAVTSESGHRLGLSLATPVIVKYRDSRTDMRTELEAWIR